MILLAIGEGPGGMSPTYPAADYDDRLTREAKTGTAVIAALKCFHDEHAGFPADARELKTYLATGAPSEIQGWRYSRNAEGLGFTLPRRLGWDPDLIYEFDGVNARWIFSPGDGSPARVIALKP
jgi:hypothetical protein